MPLNGPRVQLVDRNPFPCHGTSQNCDQKYALNNVEFATDKQINCQTDIQTNFKLLVFHLLMTNFVCDGVRQRNTVILVDAARFIYITHTGNVC